MPLAPARVRIFLPAFRGRRHAPARSLHHRGAAALLQRFHDLCLVRAPALQKRWGLAFFEYTLQVPANRIGYGYFSAAELKTVQEVISLCVFMAFSVFWLHEPLRWNHVLGFALIVLAAWVIFKKW